MEEIPEFEMLKRYIQQNNNGKLASGGQQVTMRCPFCGDSRDPRNQHMYIGPDKRNDLVLSYHCFLCNTGGVITPKFFREINCLDSDLINLVIEYNRSHGKRMGYARRYLRRQRIESADYVEMNGPLWFPDDGMKKLEYVNSRMGSNLTFDDCNRLKIILNLVDWLRYHHLGNITRDHRVFQELSANSIGFLSVDNSQIILRTIGDYEHLHPSIARRYNNYTLDDKPQKFLYYVIPGMIDPTKPYRIFLTEGPFDILSVYLNVIEDKSNAVFIAAAGKAQYAAALQYVFSLMRLPPYLATVHLYSDNDMSMSEYNKVIWLLRKFNVPLILHSNTMEGEKDFGVPRDRIIDTIISL